MSISVVGDGLLLSQKGDLVVADGTAEGRLAVGSNGQILTASSTDSLGVKWINAPTATQKWTTIAVSSITATGGSAASLEFTSIPQTYDDLKLIGCTWTSGGSATNLSIAMSTSTTGTHWDYRFGNEADSFNQGYNQSDPYFQYANLVRSITETGERRYGSVFVLDIRDYSSTTKTKSAIFLGGYATTVTTAGYGGNLMSAAGTYNSTSAINYIKIYVSGTVFWVPSYAVLVGVKRS